MTTLSPTPTPGCEASDAGTFGALVGLALIPFTLVVLWRTYRQKKDHGSSILVQLLCDRPRFIMVTVYSVVLILGVSAVVDACGGLREISVDADLQAYIRCDHSVDIVHALSIAREIALTSSCGVQRRRLASASPAGGAGDWRPRPPPRPDRRQLNHIPLPTRGSTMSS